MDVSPTQHQDPATGDDELAKVLAGVSDDATTGQNNASTMPGLQFEETPAKDEKPSKKTQILEPSRTVVPEPTPQTSEVSATPTPVSTVGTSSATDSSLDDIKRSALEELRPLVDKLNVTPEEKFDTLLLIIRSTDDHSLVQAAHDAAKAITDETKRAQALLDVIKEIDYFASQPQVA